MSLAFRAALHALLLSSIAPLCGGCGGHSSSGKPNPSPTPVSSVETLGAYLSAFGSLRATDSFAFRTSSSLTAVPDPSNLSYSSGPDTTTYGGSPSEIKSATGSLLYPYLVYNLDTPKTQVTITLPRSGEVSVTRAETATNSLGDNFVTYDYYKVDALSGTVTIYGSDTLRNGRVYPDVRYDPGVVVPLDLAPGATMSQTYTKYETEYINYGYLEPEPLGSFQYDVSSTITLTILPNLSVAAGTYSDVGQLQISQVYTLPVAENGATTSRPATETDIYDLSKYAGILRQQTSLSTQNNALYLSQGLDTVTVTFMQTRGYSEEMTSANVGGTAYPPGRSTGI